MHVRL